MPGIAADADAGVAGPPPVTRAEAGNAAGATDSVADAPAGF